MEISTIKAMQIGHYYPDNIKLSVEQDESTKKFAGFIHLDFPPGEPLLLTNSDYIADEPESMMTTLENFCQGIKSWHQSNTKGGDQDER